MRFPRLMGQIERPEAIRRTLGRYRSILQQNRELLATAEAGGPEAELVPPADKTAKQVAEYTELVAEQERLLAISERLQAAEDAAHIATFEGTVCDG